MWTKGDKGQGKNRQAILFSHLMQVLWQDFPLWALWAPALLWQLYFVFRYWWPVVWRRDAWKEAPGAAASKPLSLVIAARNEADNLRRNLPVWMAQSHPDFEVVVVNDSSWDETALVLKEFAEVYPRLRIVSVEEQDKYPTGKKFALTLGIKAASHPHLVFTDADCRPASETWLSGIQGTYRSSTELVLGHVQLENTRGLLGLFQQTDALFTSVQCYGHALTGQAFMGRGGNLSYLRNLFFYHKGFSAHLKHLSGDDGLFVNQAATPSNVRVCLQPSNWTYTQAPDGWGAWWSQKRRHLSSSAYLRPRHRLRLGVYGVTLWMLLAWPAVALHLPWVFSLPVAFYFLNRWLVLGLLAARFKQAGLLPFLPVLDLLNLLLRTFWTLTAPKPSRVRW